MLPTHLNIGFLLQFRVIYGKIMGVKFYLFCLIWVSEVNMKLIMIKNDSMSKLREKRSTSKIDFFFYEM